MTAEEIDTYLLAPWRFAALSTLRKDGSPFVIPMGYYYDGHHLYFSTTPKRGLATRLRRDPRVSVAIFDHEPIHGYVLINAAAEEVPDPDNALSMAMHRRYPKPGIPDQEEHDRLWLSEGRIVFAVPTAGAIGMDQRKATSFHALAMPDAPPRS